MDNNMKIYVNLFSKNSKEFFLLVKCVIIWRERGIIMYSLYIDTHYTEVCVVLFKDKKVLDKEVVKTSLKHSVITMPTIKDLIERNNITVDDINEVIVCNGPGSFTGVRIGVTIGKTMAFLRNIPIKVIDSLLVKYISLNEEREAYVVIEDKNGAYVGHFFNK